MNDHKREPQFTIKASHPCALGLLRHAISVVSHEGLAHEKARLKSLLPEFVRWRDDRDNQALTRAFEQEVGAGDSGERATPGAA